MPAATLEQHGPGSDRRAAIVVALAFAVSMLAYELDVYRDHAWWTPAEMLSCGEVFLPIGLADLLGLVLRGELPAEPMTIE